MYKSQYIDFAHLKGGGRIDELRDALEQVILHKPRGVCLNPVVSDVVLYDDDDTAYLFEQLSDLAVLREFVIDFPLGQGGSRGKLLVAERLLSEELADEFDVVANVGAILDGNHRQFSDELDRLVELGKPVKVIVETGYYPTDYNILERVVHWCAEVGAYAIKTSTGFIINIDNSLKLRQVSFWKDIIDREHYGLKIKDSGGKRTREDIDNSLTAGADIIGVSSLIL